MGVLDVSSEKKGSDSTPGIANPRFLSNGPRRWGNAEALDRYGQGGGLI